MYTQTKVKKMPGKNHIKEARGFMAVDITVMILFSLFCILPIINVVAVAFSGANLSVGLLPRGFTTYSFSIVLRDKGFFRAFFMSVFMGAGGTALSVTVNFLAAYPLSKKDLPFRKGIMVFFVITMLFSGGIVPNFLWFKSMGIVDTPFVLLFPLAVQFYYITLFVTYFDNIPQSLEDAARIDGADKYSLLIKIIMPMCIPIIITVTLFTVVGYWNNYQLALYYIPTKSEYYPLPMFILNFINGSAINDYIGDIVRANHKRNIEAALIIVSMLPIVAAYPFTLRHFTRGASVGAVKE